MVRHQPIKKGTIIDKVAGNFQAANSAVNGGEPGAYGVLTREVLPSRFEKSLECVRRGGRAPKQRGRLPSGNKCLGVLPWSHQAHASALSSLAGPKGVKALIRLLRVPGAQPRLCNVSVDFCVIRIRSAIPCPTT